MAKRKAEDDIDWETQPCPLCTVETLPQEERIQWLACEACQRWFHISCLGVSSSTIAAYYCDGCAAQGKGTTKFREERPKRAKLGIDYTALDSGQHINSLRHAYTSVIETRAFSTSLAKEMDGAKLSRAYLHEHGFTEPIIVHDSQGLDMSIPQDLTVDQVAELVGKETPVEVMDVPTQDEDRGWTLGRWAAYYNEPSPVRVRNVISLEVSNTKLGDSILRPRIVRDLDVVSRYWPQELQSTGKTPKVQTYCLMSLQNSYTDFHVDFAGTSVYYHILQGAKTFLFIPPSTANLNKYSDWCKSSNQATTFLADECKDTFKVELKKGDTMLIPSGWIHAVHTPQKSLVIGGNFLHLHGMQKHLEIADIEELTKVPGKFRFPYFNKTLWFTAIGILVQREIPSKFEIVGMHRLATYLYDKAEVMANKSGRKSLDEVPLDYMQASPMLIAKLLHLFVQYHAKNQAVELPDTRAHFALSSEEDESCPAIVKSDISRLFTAAQTSEEPGNDESKSTSVWIGIPKDPESPLESKAGGPKTTAMDTSSQIEGVPAKPCSPPGLPPSESPNPYAENNSYLPPLRHFGPLPPVTFRTLPTPTFTPPEVHKGPTTCFRCKTRKRKCDKERPCDSCKEAGLASTCTDSGGVVSSFSPGGPVNRDPLVSTPSDEQQTSALAMNGFVPDIAQAGTQPTVSTYTHQESPQNATPVATTPPAPKSGSRCGRCAKDKRPCGREKPVCDRCQKKELGPADCIYPPARGKNASHHANAGKVKTESSNMEISAIVSDASGQPVQ